MNEIAREFAEALKRADWEAAGRLMDEETATRCAIVPARMTVIGEKLQGICNEFGAGFATAGSGNGGCVWALAPHPGVVSDLSAAWREVLSTVPTARILPATVDPVGLEVKQVAPGCAA